MEFSILIVDDDRIVCDSLKRILGDTEYEVKTAYSGNKALEIIDAGVPDLVILDLRLPDMDGLQLLKHLKKENPDVVIILLTAYGNIPIAVEAMKYGAYDFLEKETEPEIVRFAVQKALDNIRLRKEVRLLRQDMLERRNLAKIIAESNAMKDIIKLADQFAESDTTVLLTGETGTGKSLLGEYIHYKSKRFNRPFLTVNCGAIPRELIESELFGYEKGAFTGAHVKGKIGLIEKANGGTVFLDEIAELSLDIQAKLLQVLEKLEFFRVGGVEPIKVDVRFIVATNAKIEKLIEENKFRMDLFYRVNVASLEMPPLRERKEDILPITKYFVQIFNEKFNKNVTSISKAAQQRLNNYSWPGNIRELKNVIERIMILKKNSVIDEDDLCHIQNQLLITTSDSQDSPFCITLGSGKNLLHETQKILIERALNISNNNKTKAAQLLGIARTSLQFYIEKFKIVQS